MKSSAVEFPVQVSGSGAEEIWEKRCRAEISRHNI